MRRLSFFFLLVFFCFAQNNVFAQYQKEHTKSSYVDSLGRFYLQTGLPLRIYVSTPTDTVPVQLKEAQMKEYAPIYLDGNGLHNLRHVNAEDKRVENFQLYADGVAPATAIYLTGAPTYRSSGGVFYGKSLAMSLRAVDDMSGVKEILYSLNGKDYTSYQHSFSIAGEGSYTYRYYSVDNVGNVESAQSPPRRRACFAVSAG